jgi:hypothetical protein
MMLNLHGNDPEFLEDVLGDNAGDLETVVGGVIAQWEGIADSVPGRYTTLSVDNLATVLQDAAGLRALRRDLELAAGALDGVLARDA